MSSKVEFRSLEELYKMPTGTLMSRRAALLKCEESFKQSDRNGYEEKPKAAKTKLIEFKDTIEWQQAYSNVKTILASREHVSNKQERKAIRQAKAKSSK